MLGLALVTANAQDAVVTQAPVQHCAPEPHAVPHAPQLSGSVPVVLQTPEQLVCPEGQETAASPPLPSSPPPPSPAGA